MLRSGGEFQKMRIMPDQEGAQQFCIVRTDREPNTWPARKLGAPLLNFRRQFEEIEVDELIEHVEIAKYRRKHGVHKTKAFAREKRTGAQRSFDPGKFCRNRSPLSFEYCSVGRCFQAPHVAENCGTELHPRAMLGAFKRVLGMQARPALGFL